jgi:hypothetical protein
VKGSTTTCLTFLPAVTLACVDPLTNDTTTAPEWHVKNIQGYARTATGEPPDITYGWSFSTDSTVARWFECSRPDTCGKIERERPRRRVC